MNIFIRSSRYVTYLLFSKRLLWIFSFLDSLPSLYFVMELKKKKHTEGTYFRYFIGRYRTEVNTPFGIQPMMTWWGVPTLGRYPKPSNPRWRDGVYVQILKTTKVLKPKMVLFLFESISVDQVTDKEVNFQPLSLLCSFILPPRKRDGVEVSTWQKLVFLLKNISLVTKFEPRF